MNCTCPTGYSGEHCELEETVKGTSSNYNIVNDFNHYFGLDPILKPKPKLAYTFSPYHNRYD